MFAPDDPARPPQPAFEEPWQAQALALADALVRGGHVAPSDWAEALGSALRQAEVDGAPDTVATYYGAVVSALEAVTEGRPGLGVAERDARRAAWDAAYRPTPHGQPVVLAEEQA
ncbi:MAG: nitrile hydratase accessory protein [Pseudomonadota bacterium]